MIYFTSDWHFGEDRIGLDGKANVFYRPFQSVEQQNQYIANHLLKGSFKDGDTLYHLGDVIYDINENSRQWMRAIREKFSRSKLVLIEGNYDVDKLSFLGQYFDEIHPAYYLDYFDFGQVYLNHYPTKTLANLGDAKLGITGHVHSLWKVQKHLINVGVDAWHFRPVSEEEIQFCFEAMKNHYDRDVFPYDR